MAKYEVEGAQPGFVTVPDSPSGGGGSSAAAPAWEWRMVYYWAKDYTVTLAAGYGNDVPYGRALCLQKGAPYPAGYRVANGQPGGGYAPSGAVATGNEPIKLSMPTKGVGVIKFFSTSQIWVQNPDASRTGSFVCGLGVADVNGPSFPQWPAIGVGHYLEMEGMPALTVRPGDTVLSSLTRLDIVDNAFMSGADAIPTWPNWEMKVNETTKLFPAVAPMFQNRGQTALKVMGFWGIAYATL